MQEYVKDNILRVLDSLERMFSSDKMIVSELKMLSDELIDNISIYNDKDSITLSVLVYSLYKILSKNSDIDKEPLRRRLSEVINHKDSDEQFRTKLRKMFDDIRKYDKDLNANIIKITKHAQVNKGLTMYEQGLSIGRAAEIMGVSKWDIMEYLGSTNILERDNSYRIDPRNRLEFTKSLFTD